MTFPATWFDGRSSRAHAVELAFDADGMHVRGDGIERHEALDAVRLSPRLARVERTLSFADGARARLADSDALDAWFPHRDRLERVVDRLERHAHAIAASIVLTAATLAAAVVWGVPWLADRIATALPPAASTRLGEQVLAQLDRMALEPTGLPDERRAQLATRFAAVAAADGGAPAAVPPRLEFRSAPGIGANAFALPGGAVVVTDELVEAIDDDREFDAIVAHELGHQAHSHALRGALRGSIVLVVSGWFAGDVSGAGAVVAGVPTFLLQNAYSRQFESEADAEALHRLAALGTSPRWFARALEHLDPGGDEWLSLSKYASSHPATHERIAAAERAAEAMPQFDDAPCAPDALCEHGVSASDEDEYDEDAGADTDEDCDEDDCDEADGDEVAGDDD